MIYETLKLSSSALWAHKLRTTLTLIGVVIGVASVIAIISVLEGMMTRITNIFGEMGATSIYVTRFGMITSHDDWLNALKRKKISTDDARAIARGCSFAEAVGISVDRNMKIKYQNKSMYFVQVQGLSANAAKITDIEIAEGRFLSDYDDEHRQNVAVIGQELVDKFFPFEPAIGKEIVVRGAKFKVIGVGEKKGSILGENLDRYVYIPANTFLKLTGLHQDVTIMVKVKSEELLEPAMDQIRAIMRARRHVDYNDPDDFAMITKDVALAFVNDFTSTARVVGMAIPMISIVVAGIVVMNIMMVSVTERTREIGIRKSVGAKRRNILMQFLLEALMMCLLGGLVGLTIGLVGSNFASSAMGVPFVISIFAISMGIAIPASIGIFFGIYPAWKASKLDPVEALRFE